MTAEQAADLARQLDTATARARALAHGRPVEELTRRTADGRWSCAENLVHLTLTTRAFLPDLRTAVDSLARRGAKARGRARLDLWGWLLRWALEPPPRFAAKTPPPFVPPPDLRAETALDDFLASQEPLSELVRAASGLAVASIKVTSPFNARMRYGVYSAFVILAAHQRRHLWQAARALGVPEAP